MNTRQLIALSIFAALGMSTPNRAFAQQPPARANQQRPQAQRVPESMQPSLDVEYAKVGDVSLKLDVYVPKDARPDDKLPLVVWIHGGGWSAGDKRGGPFMQFAGKGYVLASVNYRLSQQAIFPAQIHDCKAAIRYLRANAGKFQIDPDRIGVWGSSAGGHLVALLGTSGDVKELEGDIGPHANVSSRVQAVVDWFGPTDLTAMGKQSGPNSRIDHDAANSPESRLLGGPVQEKKELARQANPMTFVSKDDPAFLVMHGDADPLVPPAQGKMLHEALKAAGVDTTFHLQPGAGHGLPGAEMQAMVEKFFERKLKPKK